MCFGTFEDLTGKIECVIFPKTFAELELLLEVRKPVLLKGTINLQESPRKISVEKIYPLNEQTKNRITGLRLL